MSKTFDIAAYNQILENMNQMKRTLEDNQHNTQKHIEERNKVRDHMMKLKGYIKKEMKNCNCEYTKSKAKRELERMMKWMK